MHRGMIWSALGHFVTPFSPRKSGFFQRKSRKRVRGHFHERVYIGYHQALELPKNLFPFPSRPFENFLRSNSIFIGPESDHWQCLSVTNSLTDWLLFSKLNWCDPGVWRWEVVFVADADTEDNVGNSLLQTWELMFGPKAKLWFRIWAQGLVKILKLKLRQDFETGVCSEFCCWCFVEVMKLYLGRDSEARFGQDFEF